MRDEAKIFKTVAKNGGQITRAELSTRVFGRNKSAAELDALLKAPMLIGLLVESRAKVRKGGRVSIRYTLTPAGWKIARAWQLPTKTERIAPEETLRQFQTLVADGHPFASALSKDAAAWRTHQVEERRKREEKAAAAKERKRERELSHPPVKHPSKGRSRSSEDLATRSRWFEAKKAERAPTPTITPTFSPARPGFRDGSGVTRHGGSGGFLQTPTVPTRPTISPTASPHGPYTNDNQPYLNGETLALIRKITSAGYRTNANGEVLYDNRWIAIPEWLKLMPGAID